MNAGWLRAAAIGAESEDRSALFSATRANLQHPHGTGVAATMRLTIETDLTYTLPKPASLLLQIEAADIAGQQVERASLDVSDCSLFDKVAAQDGIGTRIWLHGENRFTARYQAEVDVTRPAAEIAALSAADPHELPGETIPYLFDSLYCPASRFETFIDTEFSGLTGGARIAAFRTFIHDHFDYAPGSSDATTTAADTFVQRQGVCRDYAHVLIALARSSGVPARFASVYGLGVDPPDFHAVAEVYLGGAWHLVDATGMSAADRMAVIGIGRDAADVSFLTAFGTCELVEQRVSVREA